MAKALESVTKPVMTLLGGSEPKAPKVAPVTPMADDDAVAAARRRSLAATQQRSGVLSTMLSGSSGRETLG